MARWAKGKAPAQGSTPQKITKPGPSTKSKVTSAHKKGQKTAAKKGTSPLDGRKRGK